MLLYREKGLVAYDVLHLARILGRGLGADAYTVTTRTELTEAICAALSHRNVPAVINCIIDSDATVVPMVPSGKSIEDPILEIEID